MKVFACKVFFFLLFVLSFFFFSTSPVLELKVNTGSFDLCLAFLTLFGLLECPASLLWRPSEWLCK